jgi:hypothetical protein
MTLVREELKLMDSGFPAKNGIVLSAIPSLLYLAALLLFIKNRYSIFDFPLDDAWIHRVYAQSFAFGHGFSYNVGHQEAGSSSPLWTIVTAPAHWLDVLGTDSVVLCVKAIGIVLGLVCVLTVQRIVLHLTPSKLSGVIAASLFALEPKLLFSALSGMETCLVVALLLGACFMFLQNRHWWFLLFMGLAPLARPETLVLLPLAFAGVACIWAAQKKPVAGCCACLVVIAPTLLWMAFCRYANGHLFPNTYYLKARSFTLGVQEFENGFQALTQNGIVSGWVLLAGVVAFCAFCLRLDRSKIVSLVFLVAAPAVYFLSVTASRNINPDGYYWTRWLDPASLLLTAAFSAGLGFAFESVQSLARRLSGRFALLKHPLALALPATRLIVSLAPTFVASFRNRRDHLASDSRAISIINVQMGKWIAKNTPPDAVIGVNDSGAIRYFGRRKTVDLLGLNNAEIAFGKISPPEIIARLEWLAIFPGWFSRGFLARVLAEEFEPRNQITIPVEEYTIYNDPEQTLEVAFQRKVPARFFPNQPGVRC